MKEQAEVYDISKYENVMFFCMNCANIMTAYLNTDGTGKVHCPICDCDISVQRFRRKYRFELFDPGHPKMYLPPEIERLIEQKKTG